MNCYQKVLFDNEIFHLWFSVQGGFDERFHVIEFLIDLNLFSIAVDPYVIMECEGTKVRTPTKKDVTDADFEYGGLFYIKKPETAMLNLEVSQVFLLKRALMVV